MKMLDKSLLKIKRIKLIEELNIGKAVSVLLNKEVLIVRYTTNLSNIMANNNMSAIAIMNVRSTFSIIKYDHN